VLLLCCSAAAAACVAAAAAAARVAAVLFAFVCVVAEFAVVVSFAAMFVGAMCGCCVYCVDVALVSFALFLLLCCVLSWFMVLCVAAVLLLQLWFSFSLCLVFCCLVLCVVAVFVVAVSFVAVSCAAMFLLFCCVLPCFTVLCVAALLLQLHVLQLWFLFSLRSVLCCLAAISVAAVLSATSLLPPDLHSCCQPTTSWPLEVGLVLGHHVNAGFQAVHLSTLDAITNAALVLLLLPLLVQVLMRDLLSLGLIVRVQLALLVNKCILEY
jgi:hypothetical protein